MQCVAGGSIYFRISWSIRSSESFGCCAPLSYLFGFLMRGRAFAVVLHPGVLSEWRRFLFAGSEFCVLLYMRKLHGECRHSCGSRSIALRLWSSACMIIFVQYLFWVRWRWFMWCSSRRSVRFCSMGAACVLAGSIALSFLGGVCVFGWSNVSVLPLKSLLVTHLGSSLCCNCGRRRQLTRAHCFLLLSFSS